MAEFFHPYYTTMLAPAVAALAAIGLAALWRAYRAGGPLGWLPPATLLAGAAAQAYILRDYPDWSRWLTPTVAGGCLLGALALVAAWLRPRRLGRAALAAVSVAGASLVAAPATWAAYSTTHPGEVNATIPTAGPSAQSADGGRGRFGGPVGANAGGPVGTNGGFGAPEGPGGLGGPNGGPPGAGGSGGPGGGPGGAGGPGDASSGPDNLGGPGGAGGDMASQGDAALIRYLEAHQGGATYLVATASSMNAAPIIIATGKPVMALGGFNGGDQILTTGQLAALVKAGTVRYFLLGAGGPGSGGGSGIATSGRLFEDLPAALRERIERRIASGGAGGPDGNGALTRWVTSTCAAVPSSGGDGASAGGQRFGAGGGQQLYDCANRPAASIDY